MLESAAIISNGEYSGYCTEDVSLDSIPAADVALVLHGEWMRDSGTGECMVRCSQCREVYDCDLSTTEFAQFYHYCPNCGAKMDRTGFKAKEFAEAIGPVVLQGLQDGMRIGQNEKEKIIQAMGIKSVGEEVRRILGEMEPSEETP